jgi:photosystem II stability/assembly factor-like uncharacterized protein
MENEPMRVALLQRATLVLTLTALLSAPALAAGRWESVGPFGGTVREIAVAPGAPRTLYAATSAGVFRSNDAGAHWRSAQAGIPFLDVASLAVSPDDPRTVYAGLFVNSSEIAGVYKTSNGGARWEAAGLAGLQTYDLAIDPRDPSTVFAATYGGLYRSLDAGESWEKIDAAGTGSFAQVVFDPSDPERLYTASSRGVFLSEDGGDTWTPRNGIPGTSVGAFAISPSGILYAQRFSENVIWRSTDHGVSWKLAGRIPEDYGIHALEVAPDEGFLYAAGDHGVFRSADQGKTWTRRSPVQRLDSVLALAVTPDAVYAGLQYRGIARSTDEGVTWRPARQGLAAVLVLAAVVAPSDPRVLYVSAEGAMILRTEDGGATWREVSQDGPPGRLLELTVDPRDARRVEGVGDYGQFWQSTDGGATWRNGEVKNAGCAYPTSLLRDMARPNRLFWTGVQTTACQRGHEDSCHNFRSTDGGASWRCLTAIRRESFQGLVPDPRNPAVYYAVGFEGVFKSADSGQTWSQTAFPGPAITLVISPNGTLWVGSEIGLFRSRNGGATWERIESGLLSGTSFPFVVIAPSNPSVLYAQGARYDQEGPFTDLYVSTDGGTSWRRLTKAGLPPAGYYGFSPLLVDPENAGRVYLGTQGGLYRLENANVP